MKKISKSKSAIAKVARVRHSLVVGLCSVCGSPVTQDDAHIVGRLLLCFNCTWNASVPEVGLKALHTSGTGVQ